LSLFGRGNENDGVSDSLKEVDKGMYKNNFCFSFGYWLSDDGVSFEEGFEAKRPFVSFPVSFGVRGISCFDRVVVC